MDQGDHGPVGEAQVWLATGACLADALVGAAGVQAVLSGRGPGGLEFAQQQAQVVAAEAGEGTMDEGRADGFDRHNQDICAAVYVWVKPPRRPALLCTRSLVETAEHTLRVVLRDCGELLEIHVGEVEVRVEPGHLARKNTKYPTVLDGVLVALILRAFRCDG